MQTSKIEKKTSVLHRLKVFVQFFFSRASVGVKAEQEQVQLGASGCTKSTVTPPGDSEAALGPLLPLPSHQAAGDK